MPPSSRFLWPIAGFYFCYFAFNGIFSPYWGLYLQQLAFSPWQIGVLMSLPQIMRVIAPALWGWLADRRGQSQGIVRLAGAVSAASFALLPLSHDFAWLLLTLGVMSFFWSASLPLVEATAMSLLAADAGRYSRLRLWGSVGFIVATLVGGGLVEYWGLPALPGLVLVVMIGIAAYSWLLPEAQAPQRQQDDSGWWPILRQRSVLALFAVTFLMALAHGPYYTFLSIHLADLGYGKPQIGWLWTVGVICEIAVFLLMPRLLQWLNVSQLLLFGLLVAALRFVLIAWLAHWPVVIVLAQALHAFTFGSHHAASMALFHRHFAGRHQAKGQALYIALSFGLGGTCGGLLAGAGWESLGAGWTFSASALAALLGAAVAWRWLPR